MNIGRVIRTTVAIAAALLAVAATAGAATPAKADKHDRALIKQLLATPDLDADSRDDELMAIAQACPAWPTDAAAQTELTAGLLIPAVFRLLDRSEGFVVAYRTRIAKMRPHAKPFRDWIAVERTDTANVSAFLQRFDSSRLDVCAFVETLVTLADDENVLELALTKLFVHPDDLAALVALGEADDALDARRKVANTRFAAFLKRSGYTRAQITALTGG